MVFRVLIAMLLALVWPRESRACECGTPAPKQAFQSSHVVFVGEPVSTSSYGESVVRVVEAFRGVRKGAVVTVRWFEGGNCAYWGLEDPSVSHLLYGWAEEVEYTSGSARVAGGSQLQPVISAFCVVALGGGVTP